MAAKNTTKDGRARSWTAVVYPESAPENWRDILDGHHFPWAESPLHDQDVDANGEVKKAHWHLLMYFEGKKGYEQVKAYTDELNAPIPQVVASSRAMVRYMAHLDNPDKVQYDPAQIIGHGGLDLEELLAPSPARSAAARYACIRDMIRYIKANDVTELMDLLEYAMEERYEDWYPLLCDNSAYIVSEAIKSQWRKSSRQHQSDLARDIIDAHEEGIYRQAERSGKADQ